MKRSGCLVLLIVALALRAEGQKLPRTGDLVFQTTFNTSAEQAAWSAADFVEWPQGYQESASLRITVPSERSADGYMIHVPLDLTRYRGCQLLFECMAKADQVTKPPQPYLGVKYMVHYSSEREGELWQNEMNVYGTFDWKRLQFTARIADDARDGELILGLQQSSGTAWFDEVRVTVFKEPPARRPAPAEHALPAFKGHDLPRLRGVMSPTSWRDEDLRVLGEEWNANVIRWQLSRNWGLYNSDRDLVEYDRWLMERLDDLDHAMAACLRYGLKVVIDLHAPPGGRYPNHELAIFHESTYQDHWVANWEAMARRYRNHPALWGYDLINEPYQRVPSPPGVSNYLSAQVRTARAIRAIDARVPIFIEAAESDSPEGFRDLEPVDIPNVIYQVHLYTPHAFTHQGVEGEWKRIAYPGNIEGRVWNREQLRRVLEPVREFQLAYNVHVYVGEFSAIRWAPGSVDYLRDCIELFEEYGWDWSFHAYREWHGWSVEHGDDRNNVMPVKETTARHQLLRDWFQKNAKPAR